MFVWFQKKSLKQKFLLSCITITLIPMIVIVALFFNKTKTMAYERQIEQAGSYADQLFSNFCFELEKAEIVASSLADFVPLTNYLFMEFPSDTQALKYYEQAIHPMVAAFNNSKSGMRVRIYHNQPLPNFSVELNNRLEEFVADNFSVDPFAWNSSFWMHLNYYPLQPVLCYFVAVPNKITYHDTAYVVSVQLKEKVFHSYIENEPTERNLILVTDRDGNVLTSNDQAYCARNVRSLDCSAEDVDALMTAEEVTLDNEKYLVISRSSDELKLAILVSDAALKQELADATLTILPIGLVLILLSAALIVFTTKKTLAGIDALMMKMRNVNRSRIHRMAKGSTDETTQDEIAQLDIAFTKMMQQIDELMDKIKNDELRLKDEIITRQQAELSHLQQQINPHYLFNTLETIRMNLVIKNDYETATVIKIFADSIRRYMNMKDQHASLLEEMTFVEKYVFIQNYRMESKIDYRLEASDAVLRHQILKLLIQPIIENSVIHGFESKTTGKQIRVSVTKQEDLLHIKVWDNGCGMDETKLEALRAYIYSEDSGKSVGLRNVFMRIKLAYGERANLLIGSKEGVGTEVTLIVPAGHG